MWSLYFAQQNVDIKTVLLIDAGSWQNTFGSHTAQTVIASSPAAARALAVQATGHQARKVQPLLDSGVRKLYTLNW